MLGGQLVIVYMMVVYTVDLVYPCGNNCATVVAAAGGIVDTGQTVSYKLMVWVVTDPMGQLVTVGGHLVMV